MTSAGGLVDRQLLALKSLARAPRPATGVEADCLRELVDLGLARFEEVAGHTALYAITPAGRRTIASSPALPRARARRLAPNATIAAVQDAGGRVYSHCSDCGATAWVDLDLAGWRYGARTKLAEREDHCLAPGCGGQITYHR